MLEEAVEGGLEELGFEEGGAGFGEAGDEGVEGFDGNFVGLAAGFVAVAEVAEGGAGEGAGGLVAGVGAGAAVVGRDGGEQAQADEAIEALVEELGGDLEESAELRGGAGGQAGVKAAADGEEDEQGEADAGAGVEVLPGDLGIAVAGVLHGVAHLAAEEDEEPEHVEAEHEDRQDAEGAVEAFGEEDAAEVEEGEGVVTDEKEGDEGGADEGGEPGDASVGDDAVKGREYGDEKNEGAGGEEEAEEREQLVGEGDAFRESVKESSRRESGEGGEEEDRAEGKDGPIPDDAGEPGATALHAPDIVEGGFDGGKELDDDEDEREGADGADGAAAGALHEAVDELDEFGADDVGLGGGVRVGGGGARGGGEGGQDVAALGAGGDGFVAGDAFVFCDLRGDEADELVEGIGGEVGVPVVEHETRDGHGEGDEGAEAEERAEAEGGGAAGGFVFLEAADRDGDDAEDRVRAASRAVALEVCGGPDLTSDVCDPDLGALPEGTHVRGLTG